MTLIHTEKYECIGPHMYEKHISYLPSSLFLTSKMAFRAESTWLELMSNLQTEKEVNYHFTEITMQNILKQVSKHKWKYSLVFSKCIIIGSQTIRERERRGGESINTFMCPCDRWHLNLEEYFHFAGNYQKPAWVKIKCFNLFSK